MTARDEAIAAMNTAKWGDSRPRMYADHGRLLDAIPADVLAQLAIERGGLEGEQLGIWWACDDDVITAEDVLYRVVEP